MILVPVPVRKEKTVAAFFEDLKESWNECIGNDHAGVDIMPSLPGINSLLKSSFQSIETSGVAFLSSIGAKMEEIQRAASARIMQCMQYREESDGGITPLLMFDKAYFSSDKLSAIQEALETVIDRLVAVQDPEAVTLEELLG